MGHVTTGSAGSLCSAAEVLIQSFGLVGIQPTFLPSPFPQNFFSRASFFSSVSPPLLLLILFIWVESLTLYLPKHRQENCKAKQSMREVSSLFPCLCSYKLVPFKIAHCKDNCASRCCYKLMTVVTLKFRELLKRVKQRTSSANLWCMSVESKTELNVVFKSVLFLNNGSVLNLLISCRDLL